MWPLLLMKWDPDPDDDPFCNLGTENLENRQHKRFPLLHFTSAPATAVGLRLLLYYR